MLGYGLIIGCGVAILLQAIAGLVVTAYTQIAAPYRSVARLAFICFAVIGLCLLGWGSLRAWELRYDQPGVVDIELSADQAQVQLQRIASLLGVSTKQPTPAIADAIIDRLPARVWRMQAVQREAFGLALDQIPARERFTVVVRSIPSNDNSIAFSEDILATLRQHGWQAESARDFGINAALPGLVIAVSPSVRTNEQVPANAKKMIVMLQKAGFAPYGAPQPGLADGQFELVIGNGPAALPKKR